MNDYKIDSIFLGVDRMDKNYCEWKQRKSFNPKGFIGEI